MPPPPTHRLPRRELQPNILTIPETTAKQNREVYGRPPVTPTLQDTFEDLSMRRAGPSQLSDGQSRDWETHPFLHSSTADRSHRDYENHPDRQYTDNRLRVFDNDEDHREYMNPTYAHDIRSSNGRPDFAAQPASTCGVLQENMRSELPTHPHPGSLNEDIWQYQQRQTRRPLRPVQVDQSGPQSAMRSQYITAGPRSSTPPFKAGPPTINSISSPFFRPGLNAPRIPSTHRPPSSAGFEYMRKRPGQHGSPSGRTGQSMLQKESDTRSNIFSTRNDQRLSDRLQPTSGYTLFEQAPSSGNIVYREPAATSQVPHDLRQSHNAREYVTSLQHSTISKQPVTASRGRITLPPSASGRQDHGLASIRGVRGGLPHRAEGLSAPNHSVYSGSRPLFSPVSRRSVRR